MSFSILEDVPQLRLVSGQGILWDPGGVRGTDTAVGVIPNFFYSTFHGVSVNGFSVLVAYTYSGDADLSGDLNSDDYLQIDYGYLHGLSGWVYGDFNYSGTVDGSDYVLIDAAYNHLHPSRGGEGIQSNYDDPWDMIFYHASIFGDDYIDELEAMDGAGDMLSGFQGPVEVPEPASLGVLGLGAVGLLGRRRRS